MPSTSVPHCSRRIPRPPDRYYGDAFNVSAQDPVQDPTRYDEVVTDIDVVLWHNAMNFEIESMYFNKVWEIIVAPEGIKPIGCKWIYKKKKGVDGKVETYKARLVAKGYNQIEGLDHKESFLPVAMHKSIRALLAIVCHYDYEIWQMDIKIAFLNEDLDVTIYMS